MKNITSTMNPLMALSIAVCLGAPSAGLAQQSSGTSSASQAQNQQQAQPGCNSMSANLVHDVVTSYRHLQTREIASNVMTQLLATFSLAQAFTPG